MLTADLVRASRRKGELVVKALSGNSRERALELASTYLDITREAIGTRREEVRQLWKAVPVGPREKRLADGLLKLIEDTCEFATESPCDPVELRRDVFERAATARREATAERPFARSAILEECAQARGLPSEDLERALYADLRGEHVLLRTAPLHAETLIERYDRAQVQAVLLRAVRLVAEVSCSNPVAYRDLFRQLKFRRLLHRIQPRSEGGYTIEIDGPYSLFDSVTKYGLNLALVLPALEGCDSLRLAAEVRWGKSREPLVFRHQSDGSKHPTDAPSALSPEVDALLKAFSDLDTDWHAQQAAEIVELPGLGLCVPDVVFARGKQRILLEVLGFWSRDAVWRRVELARRGLPEKMLFAVSHRLRVSEGVLDDVEDSALYVYKGTMNARTIARHLDRLASGG